MDVTKKCSVTGKYGFDLTTSNRFCVIEVDARYGDTIKVNQIDGVRYRELWAAYESPLHEDRPTISDTDKVIVLGGTEKESKRTVCVIGK